MRKPLIYDPNTLRGGDIETFIDALIGTTVARSLRFGDALLDWKRGLKVAHQGQFRRKTSMPQWQRHLTKFLAVANR